MRLLYIVFLLAFPSSTFAQQLTGITWIVQRNFITVGQDTIDVYVRDASNNNLDFSSFSLLLHADGTYSATTLNNQNINGEWQSNNGEIIMDNLDASSYSFLNNGDLLLFDPFLTFDEQTETFSIPANAVIVLKNSLSLPIELIDFYARQEQASNKLTWLINESGVNYYTLERSVDGSREFVSIDTLHSRGKGNDHLYTINDAHPETSNYYRIKIHYQDHKIEYSKIIFVTNDLLKFRLLKAYPIPTSENLSIEFYAPYRTTMQLKIYNVIGKLVETVNEPVEKGTNTLIVALTNLYSGIYFIELEVTAGKFGVLRVGKS